MSRSILTTLSAVILAACAGTPFKWDDARKVKEGMSTQDVTTLVGTPNAVRAEGDVVRYVWVYVSSFEGTRTLVIDFRDGKAVKVPPIPDEFR